MKRGGNRCKEKGGGNDERAIGEEIRLSSPGKRKRERKFFFFFFFFSSVAQDTALGATASGAAAVRR